MSSGGYTPPKGGYSASTGAIIGAAAAAGVGVTYLALRSRSSVIGCLVNSNDGIKILSEKENKTYTLAGNSSDLKAGERVALRGKKQKDDSGNLTLQVEKVTREYGYCRQESALNSAAAK
jgi:hypothetical protein